MKAFKDLEFVEHPSHIGGVQARIQFENGYGVSVVKTNYSYGGKDGLYELAVLSEDGEITYNTGITDDVMGYLSPEDVTDVMSKIQAL
jgi:hypothetical protein